MHRFPARGPGAIARWLAVFLFVFVASVPGMALANQATSGEKVLTGAFDVGPGGCPECFNPLTAGAGFTWLEKYFSTLVLYDVNYTKLQGELAKSWDVSADGLTYTFHLQPDVTWHDGQPFTSADVKFTIDLAKNPDSGSWIGQKFTGVASVETPDDATAVVKLSKPDAAMLDNFTFLVMLPEHALKDIKPADLVKSDWWHTDPIGTGPFKWGKYVPGQYVELDAYDTYWRGKPKLDKLINRYYPEAGSSVIALRKGEISFTYLQMDEANSLAKDANLKVIAGPSQVANALVFNMTDPRFKDVQVRQAFMYAIDRKTIVDQLYGGKAQLSSCMLTNSAYVPKDVNPYDYNPDKAKELLKAANWDSIKGKPIEVVTYYQDQTSQDVLVAMQQNLQDVGIDITIRVVDTPTFQDIGAKTSDWTMMYVGGANGPDPAVTGPYFISSATPPTGVNRGHFSDATIDKLYAEGQTTVDSAKRAQVYQQACDAVANQLPWASMWVAERFGGVSTKVQNFIWTPGPGGGRYYDAAQDWDIAS